MNSSFRKTAFLLALSAAVLLSGCSLEALSPVEPSYTPAATQPRDEQSGDVITDADVERFMNNVLPLGKSGWPSSLVPQSLTPIPDQDVIFYNEDANTVKIRVAVTGKYMADYVEQLLLHGWNVEGSSLSQEDYTLEFVYKTIYTDLYISCYTPQSWPQDAMPGVPQLDGVYYSKPDTDVQGKETYVIFVLDSAYEGTLQAYPALLLENGFVKNEADHTYFKDGVTYKNTDCTLTLEYSLDAPGKRIYIMAVYTSAVSPDPGI
ncbi:MAG: hypothetical protein ACYCX2_05035 [Christensenellales bacterium]